MSSDLQVRLERLHRSLGDDAGARGAPEAPLASRPGGQGRLERQERKREEKLRRARDKRRRERASASTSTGLVLLLAALLCTLTVLFVPHLWWLLIVALGLGMGGARQLQLVGERRRLGEREPSAAPAGPHEVDVLCDQLREELQRAPDAVRGFLQDPEATVESLRATCKALDARRQQLLADNPQGQLEAVVKQREALRLKRDGLGDAGARAKLDEALRSLDAQEGALRGLKAAVERVDGEYTSLLVLLQELRTRVALAQSAGSGAQLEGVQHSVQRLNTELEAITEALDAVRREGLRA